jgi:hypothetical protein
MLKYYFALLVYIGICYKRGGESEEKEGRERVIQLVMMQ